MNGPPRDYCEYRVQWFSSVVTGKNKSLSALLEKFGGIRVIEGYICRGDEKKLLNIEKNVREFREKCQQSLFQQGKRCMEKENLIIYKKPRESVSGSSLPVAVNDTPVVEFFSRQSLKTHPQIRPRQLTFTPERVGVTLQDSTIPNTSSNFQSNSTKGHKEHDYERKPIKSKHVQHIEKKEESKGVVTLNAVVDSLKIEDSPLSVKDTSKLVSLLMSASFSTKTIAEEILKIPQFKHVLETLLMSEITGNNKILTNRKNGKLSYLIEGDYNELKTFNWDDVVGELWQEFPLLAKALVAFVIPSSMDVQRRKVAVLKLVPKIGTIYGVLAQARQDRLSKVQKIVNILLYDNICDQKVFDRLHTMGLCLCYGHSLTILEKIGGNFKTEVIDALKNKKRIRIVGDNINWYTGVRDVRQDHHGHMHHAFGSAIIVQNTTFDHLDSVRPQRNFDQCPVEIFLPDQHDWDIINEEYVRQICNVAVKHLAAFDFLKSLKFDTTTEEIPGQKDKNKIIPLPLLYCNEQKYEDVVKIMDFYENLLDDCFSGADKEIQPTHIGGDQLTRERFSGAKRLRIGGTTAKERFSHLSPITFEFFHLMMNFMKLILQNLYDEDSVQELGTMKSEQSRILRDNVNVNVNEHYDADKDFVCSFTDAYIVEALLDFFGMEDMNARPTKHIPPPAFPSKQAKETWTKQNFREVVDTYVFNKKQESSVEEEGPVYTLKLSNGETRTLLLKRKPLPEDNVKNYAHTVLELGMLFKGLLRMCKSPVREKALSLIKLTMLVFKANNNLSKYAYECMRFLVQQLCTLSVKEATEQFYGMFVNTKGRLDSYIPTDLQMEYIVKLVKKHLKHMYSNQTQQNISTRTGAITAMVEIGENFDERSGVIVRAKKHSTKDSKRDEVDMITDLRSFRPFTFQSGRRHATFPGIKPSVSKSMDPENYRSWIEEQKDKWATEIGQ